MADVFSVSFVNLNDGEEVVEYVPKHFQITVNAGSGTIRLIPSSTSIFGISTAAFQATAGQTFSFEFMASPNRQSDNATLYCVLTDDLAPASEVTLSRIVAIVKYNDTYPIKGAKITWNKVTGAVKYRIRRKNKVDEEFSDLIDLLHDPQTGITTQWFIDRTGQKTSKYCIAAIADDGEVGEYSLPKHAPDIDVPMCMVQGNITDISLTPISGMNIEYRIKDSPFISGNTMAYKNTLMVQTDTRGYFEFSVPQNSVIQLSVPDVGFKKQLITPLATSADLSELLAMPQNQEL